jgi:hypothetical protein
MIIPPCSFSAGSNSIASLITDLSIILFGLIRIALYKYFDITFYKFPSYFRRDAISQAFGHVSSFYSNLKIYEAKRYEAISNGKKFKEKRPKLQRYINTFPCFYKNNMYYNFFHNKKYDYLARDLDCLY